MLYSQFDLQIARFPTFASVDSAELQQADVLKIDEYVEGGVYHSTQLNWKGDLTFFESPEAFIRSAKERSALEQSRQYFLEHGYQLQTSLVTLADYQHFLTLYKETTLHRNRAIDVQAEIIITKNLAAQLPVRLFGLYQGDTLVSGLLVSQVKEELRVMFGAKKRFDEIRGGIGGVLEMELLRFCFANGIHRISHGLSTNPAGMVDKAGVFEFKSRYGFTAFPLGEWQTSFILSDKVAQSDLVFVTADQGRLVHTILTLGTESVGKKYQTQFVQTCREEPLAVHMQRARQLFKLL